MRDATRLLLVCHAPTRATRSVAFPKESEALDGQPRPARPEIMRWMKTSRCRTSPSSAAVQTAEAWGVRAEIDGALRECDYGRWAGRSYEAILAERPGEVEEWLRNPESAPHGGESIADLVERVSSWLEEQARIQGKVLALTHSSIIRAAIVTCLNAPLLSFWRLAIGPYAQIRLSRSGGEYWNLGDFSQSGAD